jgi:hypothetical protein
VILPAVEMAGTLDIDRRALLRGLRNSLGELAEAHHGRLPVAIVITSTAMLCSYSMAAKS